ncbi:alpha-2-macroglobulin-like isoform X2 [Pseudophryne corroboree]|uniref:alpha-2-macroglobulin-like isoform X2 n=1 Tax=Pseudophryne corroboree TaxID=495146 RepID=UPI003081FF58
MVSCVLCLGLILLHISGTVEAKPHYVITVPAQLVQGSQQKACVTFLDLDEVIDVRLELQKDEKVQVVAEQKINTPEYSQCFSFKVPVVVVEDWSVWLFRVSAHGKHLNVNETKKILIHKAYERCLVQTDKDTYKPGDTVKFRFLTVDYQFHASERKYATVELKDPNGSRIGQWLNVSSNHGFADFGFPLANELTLGVYRIKSTDGCETEFTVSEYVLKRFQLQINLPPNVTLADKSFLLESCGSYTYGKPVEGSVDFIICPRAIANIWQWGYQPISNNEEHNKKCLQIKDVKTDNKGCLSREINLSFFNFSTSDRKMYLTISASLTEDGTGHTERASNNLMLGNYRKLQFVDTGEFYYRGIPFQGKVKVVDEKNHPMANEVLSVRVQQNLRQIPNVVTDKNGFAHFTLNTSRWSSYVSLAITLSSADNDDDNDYRYAMHISNWLLPFYSESNSFLTLEQISDQVSCDSDLSVNVQYDINKSSLDPKSDHLTFFYYLLSKGGITSYKQYKLNLKEQANSPTLHGSFPIQIHVDSDLFPAVHILIFSVLPKGETIAGRAIYNIAGCSKTKVQLSFSEAQVRPGDKVNLKLTAESETLCSVRSVDKGFLLHKAHEDTSLLTDFTRRLSETFTSGQYRHPNLIWDPVYHRCQENETVVQEDYSLTEVSALFEAHNLKVFTNTQIKRPVRCAAAYIRARSSVQMKKIKTEGKGQELKKHLARTNFPDTWLFDLVSVGPEGHTVLNLTTPDSITKWETDAFCIGKSGLGEIKNVGFTTFKPYFIDLILPYSVVQGEKFTIKALVFSYKKNCSLVVASLSDSNDFTTVQSKEQARCVCEGHSTHFTWNATVLNLKNLKIHVSSGSLQVIGTCTADPLLLGKDHREDSIEKTIVVKARGHEEQKTETYIIYPAHNSEKIQVSFQVPDRMVPGSERAHIIVLGDLMANFIINLDDMLHMPEGCGEQNTAKLLRNVYSLQYLQSTKELTPQTQKKIVESLIQGYQTVQISKNEDNAYSLHRGSPSNLWLTAYVVKFFSSAQGLIYIDETQAQQAVTWLNSRQLPNGCFDGEESYFNNDVQANIVENALKCLKNEAHSVTTTFTQALLAYAFTLSGDSELRQETLEHLEKAAIKKDGFKHWQRNMYNQEDIETTSYVVLALLSKKTITQRDLEESADIVRWLLTKQKPRGGFGSSQDTTVALQALAKYAQTMHHKKGDATVTVESKSGFYKEIHVDKSNSLLLQTVDLPEFPGEYTVTVTGNGYVYVQSHLHYSSLPVKSDAYFVLNVSSEPAICTHEGQTSFEVHVDVRYSGGRAETNMALITVEFLSGFHSDETSVNKLRKNPAVDRTEVSADKVTIYLTKLTHVTERFAFGMTKETHVENLQPANVIVYDYYVPDENTVAEYNSCSAGFEKDKSH